jgi:hypothetical protein
MSALSGDGQSWLSPFKDTWAVDAMPGSCLYKDITVLWDGRDFHFTWGTKLIVS